MGASVSRAPSHLFIKHQVYYFRMVVPLDLRPHLGRSELRYSLGTAYLVEARAKATRGTAKAQAIFSSIRKGIGTMAELTHEKARELADRWLREALQDEEDKRLHRKRPLQEDQLEEHLESLAEWEGNCREALALGNYRFISSNVEYMAQEAGLEIPVDSPGWRVLARELLKAAVTFHQVERRRSMGDYTHEGPVHAPTAPLPYPASQAQPPLIPSIPLSQLVETFVAEKVRRKEWSTERSRQAGEAKLKFLLSVVGGDLGHTQLAKEHLRQVSRTLEHIPERMALKPAYKDKTLAQIMAMKIPDSEKLAPGTLGTYIHPINAFLDWLEAGYDGVAPGLSKVLKVSSAVEKVKREVVNFTSEDLRLLFNTEGYKLDKFRKPWQFWLLPLLMFTGARLEEICQLQVDDIHQVDGIWVANVVQDVDEPSGRHTKNPSSRRPIPLHPFLVDDLNLPGYVAQLRRTQHTQLFPGLKRQSGRYSHYVSRWFNEGERAYKRQAGIQDIPHVNKTLHSFRHTFHQVAMLQGVLPTKIQQVTGHKTTRHVANLDQGSDTIKIYTHGYPLEMLYQDVILKLDFGVDLSHLARSRFVAKG